MNRREFLRASPALAAPLLLPAPTEKARVVDRVYDYGDFTQPAYVGEYDVFQADAASGTAFIRPVNQNVDDPLSLRWAMPVSSIRLPGLKIGDRLKIKIEVQPSTKE